MLRASMHDDHASLRRSQVEQRLAALEPARRAASAARLAQLGRYAVLFVVYLCALVAGVIGAIRFTGLYVSEAPVVFGSAGLAVAVLVTAVAILVTRRMARQDDPGAAYDGAHVEQVILPLMRDALPGCAVSAASSIDRPTFDASRLFPPNHEGVEGWCGIEGRTGDVAWRASVVRARYRGRDRHGGYKLHPAFVGVYLHVADPIALAQPLRLIDQEAGPAETRFRFPPGAVFRRLPADDAALAERFHLLVTPKADALPTLSAELRRVCLDVRQQVARPIFMSFNESGVHIAIPGDPDSPPFEPGGLRTPDATRILDDLALVSRLPRVAETIGRALP
jgi:hypothetical protein